MGPGATVGHGVWHKLHTRQASCSQVARPVPDPVQYVGYNGSL
jgi:hypothetical protein